MLKKTILIAGLAGALTLLAACGGDGSDPRSARPSTDDSTTGRADSSHTSPKEATDSKSRQVEPKFVSHSGNSRACDLVAATDVAAILGEDVRAGKESTGDNQNNVTINYCSWAAAGAGSKGLASVFVRKSTEPDAEKVFDHGLESYPEAQGVEGLGVRAFYVPSTGQLNLLAADAWFIVAVQMNSDDNWPATVSAEQRQLAELVLRAY